MWGKSGRWLVATLIGGLLGGGTAATAQPDEGIGFERTPPRLSFTDGEVSFWRVGAEDWTPAQVNTALAPGDELFAAKGANLELQVGERAYLRAGAETQLGLTSLEPDFLQIRVTTGYVSLDLRSRKASQTIEIDTPNAAFTVENTGYYRVQVDGDTTTFISRRGGRATVTTATGAPAAIAPSEQVVVRGTDAVQIETYAAPELDAWDRWNYARSDSQIDAVSTRYVASGVYGVDDLDHHGDWRVVPSYGAVWVPRGVAAGWAPYSTGRWIYDPYYDWTWVDYAPWGWAPYHYGRWVHVSGYWGWCPGPIVVRPYYAPALVAFFGGGGFSIGVSVGRPAVGWVALGWGEPLVPWWGPSHFRRSPHWGGWGGPRVVNNVVVKHKTVIHVDEINIYENARVRNAIVAVDRDHFGRRSVRDVRRARADADKFKPLRGDLPVKPGRESLAAADGPAKRPPREALHRSVVATRAPKAESAPDLEPRRAERRAKRDEGKAAVTGAEPALPDAVPPTRVVEPPREGRRIKASERPPFGTDSEAERRVPPRAPSLGDVERKEKERRAGEVRAEKARKAPATPAGGEVRAEQPRKAPATPAEGEASERRASRARQPDLPREAPKSLEAERPSPARDLPAPRRERVEQEQPRERAVSPRSEETPRVRDLPGEPANRVYRKNPERSSRDAAPRTGRKKADEEGGNQADQEREPRTGGRSNRR